MDRGGCLLQGARRDGVSLGLVEDRPCPADGGTRPGHRCRKCRKARPEYLFLVARDVGSRFLPIMPGQPFLREPDRDLRRTYRDRSAGPGVRLRQPRPDILGSHELQIVKPALRLLRLTGRPSASLVWKSIFGRSRHRYPLTSLENSLRTACYHFATQLPNIGSGGLLSVHLRQYLDTPAHHDLPNALRLVLPI
jgi:hypothetical protein